MKESIKKQIENHGNNLNEIFKTGIEPIALCKKLRVLENRAHQICLNYTNGEYNKREDGYKDFSHDMNKIKSLVIKTLSIADGELLNALYFNLDPRGHCLKIRSEFIDKHKFAILTDMAKDGVLAPYFNPN